MDECYEASFVIPLTYDESLSYYEMLCKILNKINEIIDSVNELETRVEVLEEKA